MNTKANHRYAILLNNFTIILLVLFSCLSFNGKSQQVESPSFQVISTEVVVTVQGANKTLTWKDSEYKPVILFVKVDCSIDVEFFATDFVLSYYREDEQKWDRSKCTGISSSVSNPEDDVVFSLGDYMKANCKKGIRYFKVVFPIEPNVDKINLMYAKPVVEDIKVTRK